MEIYAAYDVSESENDPQTYKEEWQKAIKSELMSHDKSKTWSITDLPTVNIQLIQDGYFALKKMALRSLVAKGFQLQEENQLRTMYAPVSRMSTVRTLLVHALQQNWDLRQLDIPTAFLNGVGTEVYIKIPDRVNIDKSEVLKLDRTLYGLKESPRSWNNKFNVIMTGLHFRRSKFDFCLYTKKNCWLIVFVDDLIITGNEIEIENVFKDLKERLNARNMGEVKIF
ncbi:hypothetical protein JTB14_001894 [Gonioctena quinquepunctata]|nr:hypothetical protein JTB14_001894 [Gonioctena quinquepunctata]